MRTYYAALLVWAFVCCLLVSSASFGAVVCVDVAAQSGTSDTDLLKVAAVRVMGEQVGIFVQSTILTPQAVTIRFNGLKDQDYDIYVNGTYTDAKPAKQLEAGLKCEIPGRVVPEELIRCLDSLKPKVEAEYARLQKMGGAEAWRAADNFNKATMWINAGIRMDASYRSVEVKVGPAGKALQRMTFATRADADGTLRAAVAGCHRLQMARSYLSGPNGLKDPLLRNEVVVNLTPVDLSATCTRKNGKLLISSTLVNNCNLPISGAIMVTIPKGWKTSSKPASAKVLKSGKTFNATFELLPESKATTAPDIIKLAANVSVVEDRFAAKYVLTAEAKVAAQPAASK